MKSLRLNTELLRRQILSAPLNLRQCCFSFLYQRRLYHEQNGPRRLSEFWIPTGGIAPSVEEDSQALLVRAGFLRQVHSGIFQLLPLGVRVQEKLERLIDKHMLRIGASKVSLSTLSSEELWKKSGRLDKSNQELFHLEDRKGAKFLLSPTHEEEITSLVGDIVKSYKDLPLRLYQISRKYRDELRPRQGLLRGREFLMKDLYTFDTTTEDALVTYKIVRQAYKAFFEELKLPYMVAEADSGSIGGDLSHEYHVPSDKGEDIIVSCNECGYVMNEELAGAQVHSNAVSPAGSTTSLIKIEEYCVWRGFTQNPSIIVEAIYPRSFIWTDNSGNGRIRRNAELSINAIKNTFPNVKLDLELPPMTFYLPSLSKSARPSGLVTQESQKILRVYDYRIFKGSSNDSKFASLPGASVDDPCRNKQLDLLSPENGDPCPKCSKGSINVTKAIELGHTFHLGTRYSEPLGLSVAPKPSQQNSQESKAPMTAQQEKMPLQMGCHGIGISRMIAAVASIFADSKGLNWPSLMAPFQVVIVARKEHEADAPAVFESLTRQLSQPRQKDFPREMGTSTVDAIIDDREKEFIWKLNDADLIGYPIIVVLGRGWAKARSCEVQCRQLKIRENVRLDDLGARVRELLEKL